nr:helix-turn-helix domain-containing protein [Aeromicrobium fastidiosum]
MNTERSELSRRAHQHAALADVTRLAVMDALELGDRSPSSLQELVGLPSNLLAHHLGVLEEAGLVVRRRSEGDRRRTYLTLASVEASTGPAPTPLAVARVVFVCSANSARSQLAAALWAEASDVPVTSAGTRPAEGIADGARRVAERRHLALLSSTPTSWGDVAADGDFIVAVCDQAYEELASTSSPALHWSVPDPVRQGGDAAFDSAYLDLRRRVAAVAPRLVAS